MSNSNLLSNVQSLFNSFNYGIIVLDQQCKIVCWNNWMANFSSFNSKAALDRSLFDLFPELLNQRIHQAILQNIKMGFPATLSNILNKTPLPLYSQPIKKSQLIQQQITITRINLTAANETPYCLINITDVTAANLREKALENQVKERNTAEKRLLKRSHQLESALSVSNAGVFHFDIAEKQLYLDEKGSQLFDLKVDPKQDIFNQWTQKIQQDDLIRLKKNLNPLSTHSVDYKIDCEFRALNRNKEMQWFMLRGVAGIDDKTQKTKINGVFVNINQQKEYQNLLREKEAAELANHAKSAFLANISHELRTPLHGILSFSKLGLSRAENSTREKLTNYFSKINESGERLLYLLNDLLDLSKLEAGQMDMKFAKHDLFTLVEQIINEQRARMDELNITTECNYQAGETQGNFDNVRIVQVITNFLSNAIKFTPKHGKIILSIKQHSDHLILEVADQGVGIPEKELDLIFEKFQQSSKTIDGSGGTGLGLAICKEIIDGHNGIIGATNNYHNGATFFFKIPLHLEINSN